MIISCLWIAYVKRYVKAEERNTGKTTFLNFLKALFQDNVTFNTNEDFRSQFNSDWAGKLLIVVDGRRFSGAADGRVKNKVFTDWLWCEEKIHIRD